MNLAYVAGTDVKPFDPEFDLPELKGGSAVSRVYVRAVWPQDNVNTFVRMTWESTMTAHTKKWCNLQPYNHGEQQSCYSTF